MFVTAKPLQDYVHAIFSATGCAPPEAHALASRLVDSNLVGHDSHGIIRVSDYVRYLKQDMVRPNQKAEILSETDSLLIVDGHRGFGQSLGEQAINLAIQKTAASGVTILALRNCGHLGRIGDWPELLARSGLMSFHFVNTSGFGLLVAPFGGIDRRLSANPIAAGVPRPADFPLILDISTSAIAEGKIKVARNKGLPVPPGCIINAQGEPTDDPREFYAQPPGAILPFGGHKGFGLSFMAEMFAGALTGSGCTNPHGESASRLLNGMLSIIVDPARFTNLSSFSAEINRFIDWVKSSRTTSPSGQILLPGELEHRTRQHRLTHGFDIDDTTWSALAETGRTLGISPPSL